MANDPAASPFIPVSLLLEDVGLAPGSLFEVQDGTSALDHVGVRDTGIEERSGQLTALVTVVFEDELALTIPGLSAVVLVFGGNGQESAFDFEADLLEPRSVRLVDASLALRFSADVLRPVRKVDGRFQVDPARKQVEIGVTATITIDGDSVRVDGADELELEPCMIGDSGIVIEAEGVKLDLSRESSIPEADAAGLPATWTGVFIEKAAIHAPPDLGDLLPDDLTFEKCFIGSGGFTGQVKAEWTPALSRSLAGVEFSLNRVDIGFVQSSFSRTQIEGTIKLPFFDEPVDVTIGLKAGGGFTVKLTASDGLYKLKKAGVIEVELDSLAFEVKDGVLTSKLSGKLTPLFGGLKWPTFDVKELSIDSEGHVHLDGGWLDLPKQYSLDFYGFKIEIAQLGFGTNDNGTRWVGFSGGLKLVDGLQAGACVEGLRITWDPAETKPIPKISLNGAGVELKIPGVLELKGEVSYREVTVGNELIRRFDGDIELKLETPELQIDGTIVIGSAKGPQGRYNFFAIYVDVDLPTGIPVANTGLEISGFAGLFALQMEPNKKPSEMWFSIDHGKSFYHRDTPGVTDLKKKWEPRRGSFAVGAGIALRTLADNGYTFYGKFLLAIVCPGPIVLFTGAAAFLTKEQDEGQFRALAVYDGRAGSVLIGLDAEYKTGKGGEMIEIGASMEGFYAFHDPTAWHLWLGKNEPREQRIRALFGRFVEANAYFMLDAHQLALGAWFGYNKAWSFGPLSVRLEAWADGNAVLSFKPTHFHGDLWLHALVELKVFKIGLGLALDARIAADLFKPYHLRGEFSVGIKVFRKKIGAKVVLEWGPKPAMPPLALPVAQVAVEHLKSTVVWPLSRETFLLPSWDDGGGFVGSPKGQGEPSDFTKVPVIPMDARISLTFGRSVHDEAKVGINPHQPHPPEEPIGPPGGNAIATARYALKSLQLHRRDEADGKAWHLVARNPESGTTPTLFGSWMPAPALPSPAGSPQQMGNTKLLVGSRTPFDFTRRTGSSWDEWVSDAAPGYPCIPERPAQEACFGFAGLKPGMSIESPWTAPGPPAFTLSWGFGPATVDTRRVADGGTVRVIHVLCFPEAAARRGLRIQPAEPGLSFRIVLARGTGQGPGPVPAHEIGTTDDAVICVDVRSRTAATVANPWTEDGVRFAVRGADGGLVPVARLERWGKSPLGLNAGFRMEIELPCASPWVELIVTHRPPFRIVAFNASGAAVAAHAPQGTGGEATESIRLQGEGIKRLEVHAAGNEKLVHSVCFSCPAPSGPSVTWEDLDHVFHGPIPPVGGVFEVGGPVGGVEVTSDEPLCLEQICVTPDPEAGQGVRRDEAIRHIQGELARWRAEGPVFAPHTTYRLDIETEVHAVGLNVNVTGLPVTRSIWEHAYFRTGGPPGLTQLSLPAGVQTSPFETGLEDLTRYVRATDPQTVTAPGEKPILFRPFYRAFDIGVELNEDYVEQMYRMDRRDLGLYLFTASNEPARDARGRLLALANRWVPAEELTLSDKETRWITLIDNATCLTTKLDPETFPKDAVLASVEERVLAPDTLYEARLIPLLFHETFAEATPGLAPAGWYAEDAGPGGPSLWRVMEEGQPPARHVEQASGIGGAAGPERPGTALLVADPSADWTDFRLSAWVRSAAGGAVGVVFRHEGLGRWYRFALHERGRNLIKSGPAGVIVLAEDHVSHPRNRDHLLTVEAIGKSLRTYVDGEPVFAVEDEELAAGRIGLYACQSPGARFADVRVDDFGKQAPVVYRFQLTTSFFANFLHHLHSFEDELWPFDLASEPVPAEAAALTFDPPAEREARAYDDLARKVLKQAALQNPQRVEITRLDRSGQAPAFLLRSPEPIDWRRTELAVSRAGQPLPAAAVPGDLKLTDVAFGASRPEEEAVTVLLREAADLTRHRLELWDLPGPVALPEGDPVLLLESFRREAALERFTIVDAGDIGGPSHWLVEGGALLQTSAIRGGAEPGLPGTLAVTGDPEWTDCRLTADLRSDADGAVGVVFRYRDEKNHYRLSLDAGLQYRRLVKIEDGHVTILWEKEERGFTAGEPLRLIVEAVGPRLTGLLDGARIFEVVDAAHAAGRVGLYAWNNPGARCELLEVRRPSLEALAGLRDRFAEGDLSGWSLVSEVPMPQAPTWAASGGALRLSSPAAPGGDPAYPGAYAVAGEAGWKDVIVSVRLRSSGGALGVLFRGASLQSYYRFSMSRQPAYRQLVKRVGVQTTVLWRDDVACPADRSMELTIVAVGSSLRGYLDGVLLFAVEDGDVPAGRIGLYAWNNPEAWFSSVRVWPADRAFAGWLLDESFAAPALDRWSLDDPASWSVEAGELGHDPGPFAWSALDSGMDGIVHAIAVAGREIFAGGDFTTAGGAPASRIAAWDGEAWSALGGGLNGSVRAIAVRDDQVYVGGLFTAAGGIPARNLAVWDRAARTWSAIGGGVGGPVLALAWAEGRLYVGGLFNTAGTTAVRNLAAWDLAAQSWSTLGGGVDNSVHALATRGKHVYAGGRFTQAGGKPASKVARWDGNAWAAASGTINGPVTALALGEIDLYAGGGFTQVGGVAANRIARWTGAGWSPLGNGLDGHVNALVVAGNQVWVGGQFTQAGGAPASRVARWSRSARTWSAAGGGVDGLVRAIAVGEEAVHVGGAFASPANRIVHMPRGGTGHALSAEAGVDAFRLAARLRPGADGAAAVLFRWQDGENHDALWLDAERGVRRLIRTRGGMAETLWEDAVRPVAGREHAATIDVFGGRLTGYLDGVEIFSLVDGAPAVGRAGFAARRSPEARFAELRIAVPAWTLYHAFGDEELLLAGTRVQVRAGGKAPSAEPGLVHRCVALAGEQGSLRLRQGGVSLRIAGPDGRSGHSRAFLPDSGYSPVTVSALRKADGTGLFLFPSADGAPASYRLRWVYHRDRNEAGRAFSQAGSRAPERVTLDLF